MSNSGKSGDAGGLDRCRACQHDPVFIRFHKPAAQFLKSGSRVHRIADNRVVDPAFRADIADHDGSGVYADAQDDGLDADLGPFRVAAVKRQNDLKSNRIYPGQILEVPLSE